MVETMEVFELSHGREYRRGGCKGEEKRSSERAGDILYLELAARRTSGRKTGNGTERQSAVSRETVDQSFTRSQGCRIILNAV